MRLRFWWTGFGGLAGGAGSRSTERAINASIWRPQSREHVREVFLVDEVEIHIFDRHEVAYTIEEVIDLAIQRIPGGIGRVRCEGDGQT